LFEAMKNMPTGNTSIIATRMWAATVRAVNGWSIENWAQFSVRERAIMICDLKLPSWLEALEMENQKGKNG